VLNQSLASIVLNILVTIHISLSLFVILQQSYMGSIHFTGQSSVGNDSHRYFIKIKLSSFKILVHPSFTKAI